MFDNIITYSIKNKFVIGLLAAAMAVWGIYSLTQLPIDAVPDITNNQVQVFTTSPSLATQEVEQFITTPVELALQNIQQLEEIRSISRFGLSVVTVVFDEKMDTYLARQLVSEHIKEAEENIPEGLGSPELSPISTGLGEIYQYVVRPKKGYEDKYSSTELRSIQDWIVKRQLAGIDGVVEVNTLGGFLKQYEVAVNPNQLKSMGVSIADVYGALENSNENTGGAYIEKTPNTYYIRTNGIIQSIEDIENIVVDVRSSRPILVKDVAKVQFGKAPRYGALTRNGEEVVGATVMMLKGANSAAVTERVKKRVTQIQKSLPEGVVIEPYLVRDKLVRTAIGTVQTNLIEGGLIVVFILVLLLGNWRAGLIVASVIPLAMLFAVSMMNLLGISANLMSLGAIDFGLIVDGAVIIVEAIIHRIKVRHAGKQISQEEIDKEVYTASSKIRSSAAFGEIIILMVYIPILALVGIEGKMFRPMAQTVMLAIGGALILSLTYVPMMAALFLSKNVSNKKTIADSIISFCQKLYTPVLNIALRLKVVFVLATIALFAYSFFVFTKMGGEFIPTLEEGDLALHQILPPGSSLGQSVATSKIIQQKLIADFPEVEDVVTKIGSSEIPTDPMPVETGDIIVIMKPKSEWTSAKTRQEMFHKMEESLLSIPGVAYEFSQPIQMRFNELMTGSRADIAVKLYGQDLDVLYEKAKEAEAVIRKINGVGTTKVDQTVGMPQVVINFKYDKMAQYGLQVKEINQVINTAFAGKKAGVIYEGERRFDLVVRLDENFRNDLVDVENIYVTLKNGQQVPIQEVATIELVDAPMQISHENANRKIVIGVNVGNTDVETLVEEIQAALDAKVKLAPGYYFSYGGQFENLREANARLQIAVPLALALIFILLYLTFGSVWQALLIFTAIPLSAIGGIWALELRGMPFSISAGIGFIALFGVAVLNGIVLIGYFNQLKKEGMSNIRERILVGTSVRLRPVLMTAAVASLGFLPMALSTSGGAGVQRPLATVVIGGLITATFLTLIVLPILYSWLAKWQESKVTKGSNLSKATMFLLPLLFLGTALEAQTAYRKISLQEAITIAEENNLLLDAAQAKIDQSKSLLGLKYNPGITEFSYQGDGLFYKNVQRVNQVGVKQNFAHWEKIRTQNHLQTEYVKQSELNKERTATDLKLEVRQLYYSLQYSEALAVFYTEMKTLFEEYLRKATTKIRVGETNRLEQLNLQNAFAEYDFLLGQTKMDIDNHRWQLRLLLNTDELVTVADPLSLIPFKSLNSQPPSLKMVAQDISIEQAKVSGLEATLKPDFSVGYALQHYQEGGFLRGAQAGVQIPLFNQQTKQKIDAQNKQVEVARSYYGAQMAEYDRQKVAAANQIKRYKQGADFYQGQLEILYPEIERIAKLNYQAGELSYLDLLNTLELLLKHNEHYLAQILAHNLAVAEYYYLNNF